MVGHDLFPRDFIVSLDPPTNYFGAARVFRHPADTVLRDVDDHEDLLPTSHKIDHDVTGLPESLEEAVRVFVLARAIRLARGQDRSPQFDARQRIAFRSSAAEDPRRDTGLRRSDLVERQGQRRQTGQRSGR